MRNLAIDDGPIKVDAAIRDLVLELRALADQTPALGPLADELDGRRQAMNAAVEVHQQAEAVARMWNKRVVRADNAVNKAAVRVSKALDDHRDEPGVEDVIALAFPISATEGTAGVADEKQSLFVDNVVEHVKAAPNMPAKVKQRVAELEAAVAALDAALASRRAARAERDRAEAKRDQAVSLARDTYNGMYFRVGALFPNDKAKVNALFA